MATDTLASEEIEREHREVAAKIRELIEVKHKLMVAWVELNPNGDWSNRFSK